MKLSKLIHLVAATALLAGCSDSGPVASTNPSQSLLDGSTAVLQRALPGSGGTATHLIGAEGGTISVSGVTITVPAGALKDPVAITAYVPAGRDVAVELLPHGLTFKRPVSITFSLRGTGAENATADDPYAGAYSAALPQSGRTTASELFTLSLKDQTVTLQTTHFSTYEIVIVWMKGFILVGG